MKAVLLPMLCSAALVACSSPEQLPAPSQPEPFCTTARAFNAATLEAVKQADANGSISDGTLGAEYAALSGPLQQLQADLPADAPGEVRTAITAYQNELAALSSGSVATDPLASVPDPVIPVPDPALSATQPAPSLPEGLPEELTATGQPGALPSLSGPSATRAGAGARMQDPTSPEVRPTVLPTPSVPAATVPGVPDPAVPGSGAGTVLPSQDPALLSWEEAGSTIAGYIRSRCPSSATTSSTPPP